MPQKPDYPDNSTQERLESLLEIMEETRHQILDQLDTVKEGQISQELENRLSSTLAVPAK
jgi:hypothetical protein